MKGCYRVECQTNKKMKSFVMHLIDSHLSFSFTSIFDGQLQDFGSIQQNVSDMPVAASRQAQDLLGSHRCNDIIIELHPLVAFVTNPSNIMARR